MILDKIHVKKMVPDTIFKSKKEGFIFFTTFFIALSFFVYQHKFFSWQVVRKLKNSPSIFEKFVFFHLQLLHSLTAC